MKTNESVVDRILRAAGGIFLLSLALTGVIKGTLSIVAIVIGAVLLLTAAIGFCPLYSLFKISTKKA